MIRAHSAITHLAPADQKILVQRADQIRALAKKHGQALKMKIGVIVFLVIIVFLCIGVWWHARYTTAVHMPIAPFSIEGRRFTVFVAETPAQRQRGLMFVKKIPEGIDGMLFIFPEKSKQSFWNKNTFLDLDLLWIQDRKVMEKTYLPAVQTNGLVIQSSHAEVDRVLELFH